MEAYLLWKCCFITACCFPCKPNIVPWIAWNVLHVMSNVTGITGKLCNKCHKQQVKQNCSSSDSFNAISGFTSNSRASGGPVTLVTEYIYSSIPPRDRCVSHVYHTQVIEYLDLLLKVAVHPSWGQVSFSLMCTVVTQVILTSTIEGSGASLLGTGEFPLMCAMNR